MRKEEIKEMTEKGKKFKKAIRMNGSSKTKALKNCK